MMKKKKKKENKENVEIIENEEEIKKNENEFADKENELISKICENIKILPEVKTKEKNGISNSHLRTINLEYFKNQIEVTLNLLNYSNLSNESLFSFIK